MNKETRKRLEKFNWLLKIGDINSFFFVEGSKANFGDVVKGLLEKRKHHIASVWLLFAAMVAFALFAVFVRESAIAFCALVGASFGCLLGSCSNAFETCKIKPDEKTTAWLDAFDLFHELTGLSPKQTAVMSIAQLSEVNDELIRILALNLLAVQAFWAENKRLAFQHLRPEKLASDVRAQAFKTAASLELLRFPGQTFSQVLGQQSCWVFGARPS